MLCFPTNAALKCKLPSTPLGTRYEPPYRNVFSPGDTIRVICGEKYGISNHRDPSAVTTCDDDGEWTLRPICLGIKLHDSGPDYAIVVVTVCVVH